MGSKPLNGNGNRPPMTATGMSPADYPLGSMQSRGAARALLVKELEQRDLWKSCGEKESSFESGPLLWLTKHTRTENPKYVQQNVPFKAPFPALSYFVPVMQAMLDERRLFIPKSREMMTSWLAMGYATWLAGWNPGSFIVVQADKEEKIYGLVNYARILHQNQFVDGEEEPWMQKKWPITLDSKSSLGFSNGSKILGVPSGEAQIRSYHPTLYILDEAAFLPEAEQCYATAHPVAHQIIAISSDGLGWFHQITREME